MRKLSIVATLIYLSSSASQSVGAPTHGTCPAPPPPSSVQKSAVPYLQDALCRNAWNIAPGARSIIVRDVDRDVEFGAWEFDLTHFKATVVAAPQAAGARAEEWAKNSGAVFVINGGYFDYDRKHEIKPDGLLVAGGATLHPLTRALSGIFAVGSQGARIAFTHDWPLAGNIASALQSKPVLVHPGHVFGMRGDDGIRARRSAVCVMDPSHVMFIYVGGVGVTLFELAKILVEPKGRGGLACDGALNLDGGPSTQISFNYRGSEFGRVGQNIANAIIVTERISGNE